jgi:hypothetical protein
MPFYFRDTTLVENCSRAQNLPISPIFRGFKSRKEEVSNSEPSILSRFGDHDPRDAYPFSFRFSELSQPI